MIVVPALCSWPTSSNSRCASSSVSADVGSSMTISFASRAIARRISTFCWSATRSVRASLRGGSSMPVVSTSAWYRCRSARRSITPACRSSTPRKTFSSTERCGTSVGSCAMIVIPSVSASRARAIVDGAPFDAQLAGVGSVHAGQDLPQRRLARAVLADERVDRAAARTRGRYRRAPGRRRSVSRRPGARRTALRQSRSRAGAWSRRDVDAAQSVDRTGRRPSPGPARRSGEIAGVAVEHDRVEHVPLVDRPELGVDAAQLRAASRRREQAPPRPSAPPGA